MYGAAERVVAAAPALSARVAALLLIVAAVIFALVSGRDPGYARLHVERDATAGRAHHAWAAFAVDAAPFSRVELRVNGRPAASGYVPWNGRRVRFERVALDDGSNTVVARTFLWYAAFERAHADELRIVNPPSPVDRRADRPASVATRHARILTLAVREREAAAAFTVRLAVSDRAVAALARHGDLAAFVEDVFDGPRMNRASIAAFFHGVQPRVGRAGDDVVVRASSGYRDVGLDDLPALRGDLELASDGAATASSARRWSRDVVRLQLADYRTVDRVPAPLREDGTTAIWERATSPVRAPVVVSLAFSPFSSIDALRRGLGLPVFAFVPHVAARFLAFLHGFELALPMFAYLALARGRNARYARIARRLIAVAVAADVFDACISAQPDVDGELLLLVPALRALPAPLVNLLLVPAAIGAVLALLASSVAHLSVRSATLAGQLVADAANAVCLAALGFVAIAACACALPLPLVAGDEWMRVPEFAGTAFANPLSFLPLSASFLRSLAPLGPLLFGTLLAAGMRAEPSSLGLDRAALRRLMLCCYGVLAGVVVLVPISFVLAWCTYRVVAARDGDGASTGGGERSRLSPRTRGFALVPLAVAFASVDALVLLPSEMQHLRALQTPFVVLEAAGFAAVIVQSFVLPAFALGACGDAGGGRAGMRRGLAVGAWAAACSLPAWFLQPVAGVTALAAATLTIAFYAAAGSRLTSARTAISSGS
ncbi:hypothetical protein WPS_27760 [Vulcanimicrobium alpinum]|uniref:Uncharacterized protein n=1 Tax=Vulcanimicrobium alpinum TaxID=3016050 RepID=A0AAN2CAB8_UNVUL|nr:hypothetical protein [Vulcanimicrobium alpinum]BDE07500.1 hypothetical protein WPS_27760 [Vulcanimicrobium alpinum]